MSEKGRKRETEETTIPSKVSPDGNAVVVMSSGSSSKGLPSPQAGDRDWKAYFSQSDAPLTASLLAQVSGEDSNMASTLGFLYDYYGVTEETTQASSPPTNPGGGNGSPVHSSSSGHSDTEPASPVQTEQTTLNYLHAVQQIKSSGGNQVKSSDRSKVKPESVLPLKTSSPQAIQQVKIQPSQSSCSRGILGRPSSYPPSTKADSVTDTSALTLSTSPTNEAYNFGPYANALKPQTVFSAQDKYSFTLEAPTSIVQRRGDDTLTYLNKGQFYAINFVGNVDPPSSEGDLQRVKSVVHLVFRDEKDPRTEFDHWQYWHSQQPNPLQRAFDIDRKSCQNIQENIDEIAYNGAGFTWSPHLNAKIVIRINCLSTDFSSQKGVKGIPLHLQIDTYEEDTSTEPVHRAFCQIKVFRDKGAERKNKDESKSAEKRMQKWMKQSSGSDPSHPSMVSPKALFHPPSKYTILLSTTPLGPKPVLFLPTTQSPQGISNFEESSLQTSSLLATIRDREHKRTLQSALLMAKDELADLDVSIPRAKAQKVHLPNRPAVTIYVKKEEEKVYNALMLDSLTVSELSEVVARKYGMPVDMIKNVYKKTKKGILVNMDDRMIEQFVDEDDFIINLDFDNQLGHFELTLKY